VEHRTDNGRSIGNHQRQYGANIPTDRYESAWTADATIVGEDSVTNPPEAKLSPRGCTRSARQFLTLSRGSTTPSSQTRENDEMSSTSADQFSAQAISAKGARLLRLSQQIEGDEEEANRLNTVSEARDGAPIHAAPPRRGVSY
jgi:hypothetical protein